MKKIILLLAAITAASGAAEARAPKGFHEGPYFLLSGGMFTYTADNNARRNTTTGNDIEPTVGFNFGWNIKDYIAPELQTRYTTNRNSGRREYVASININAVYSFVTPQLTSFKNNVYILPFLQMGPVFQFAAVPGDPDADTSTLFQWGAGIGVGGGAKVLFGRYVYLGILAQSDFLYLNEKKQDIGGVPAIILNGGWDGQLAVSGLAGCHF